MQYSFQTLIRPSLYDPPACKYFAVQACQGWVARYIATRQPNQEALLPHKNPCTSLKSTMLNSSCSNSAVETLAVSYRHAKRSWWLFSGPSGSQGWLTRHLRLALLTLGWRMGVLPNGGVWITGGWEVPAILTRYISVTSWRCVHFASMLAYNYRNESA